MVERGDKRTPLGVFLSVTLGECFIVLERMVNRVQDHGAYERYV